MKILEARPIGRIRSRSRAQRATSARRVMRDRPNFPVLVVHRVVPAKLPTSKSDGFVLSRRNLLPQETIPNLGLDFFGTRPSPRPADGRLLFSSISRRCEWSAMRRARSSMRLMRSGFAALMSSPLAGSRVRCVDRHRSAQRSPARMSEDENSIRDGRAELVGEASFDSNSEVRLHHRFIRHQFGRSR